MLKLDGLIWLRYVVVMVGEVGAGVGGVGDEADLFLGCSLLLLLLFCVMVVGKGPVCPEDHCLFIAFFLWNHSMSILLKDAQPKR